jgi:hypothetical protein
MPINSTLAYFKQLLNGLAMPAGTPPLIAYITPPNPETDASGAPRAFIWLPAGDESRDPAKNGTVPRALYKGAPSGFKGLDHNTHIYVVWDQEADDPDADSWFPGIVDAIMWQLRVSADPAPVTDPYDGVQSQLIDLGERMTYQITVSALEQQRMYRYDCLITAPVLELLQS